MTKKTKLNKFIDKLFYLLCWTFSVFIIIIGLLFFIDAITPINAGTSLKIGASVMVNICGLLVNPSFIEYMKNKNLHFIIKRKTHIFWILFVFILITFNWSNSLAQKELVELDLKQKILSYQNNKPEIMSTINNLINDKKYEEAVIEIQKYSYVKDNELDSLLKKTKVQISLETQKENMKIAKEKQKIFLNNLYEKLSKIPENDHLENIKILEMIDKIEPLNIDNKSSLQKHKEQQKIIDDIEQKKQDRKKMISSYFSPWDGSCTILENYIKENMNDPDSYKHVETRYGDYGDYLTIRTKYRGKNAFGGTVTNYAAIKIDLNTKKITVIE